MPGKVILGTGFLKRGCRQVGEISYLMAVIFWILGQHQDLTVGAKIPSQLLVQNQLQLRKIVVWSSVEPCIQCAVSATSACGMTLPHLP